MSSVSGRGNKTSHGQKKSRGRGMSHVGKSAPQSHIYKMESVFFADLVELIR